MLKKAKATLMMSFCSALLATTILTGSPLSAENIQIGLRAESADVRAAEAQAQQAQAQQAAAQQATRAGLSKNASVQSLNVKSVQYTTHPSAYHNAVGISALGDIELEDGSIWQVNPLDAYITLGWYPTDALVITTDTGYFSGYQFKITNQSTGQAVLVNMDLGPIYNGPYTNWIIAVDYYNYHIYLNDGSVWDMSSWDSHVFNKWMVNDTVIIGVNTGFLSSINPNILINVNMLNYAAGVAHL